MINIKNVNILASKSLFNDISIVIIDVKDYFDATYCITCYVNGEGKIKNKGRNKIYYDENGDMYFNKNKSKYYINEFMKV